MTDKRPSRYSPSWQFCRGGHDADVTQCLLLTKADIATWW